MKQIVISLPDEIYLDIKYRFSTSPPRSPLGVYTVESAINDGIVLPEGHGRLKDEDKIIRAIEDRVAFLKKNDEIFMRLRKDIDILGCIPKIRCEVPTIIEAENEESEDN